MFLKCRERRKDGKVHRNWSIVESRLYSDGKVADRHVLNLGEINDSQRAAWERTIEVIDERDGEKRRLALFPSDHSLPIVRQCERSAWPGRAITISPNQNLTRTCA